VLSREPLHNSEIEQRMREAMEVNTITFEFLILGHLEMRLEPGFIKMVCFFPGQPSSACLVLSGRTCSLASSPEPPM
jgi:hypothetical protein